MFATFRGFRANVIDVIHAFDVVRVVCRTMFSKSGHFILQYNMLKIPPPYPLDIKLHRNSAIYGIPFMFGKKFQLALIEVFKNLTY